MKTFVPGGDAMAGQTFDPYDDEDYGPSDFTVDEVYRCPVSTPTVPQRPGTKIQTPIQPFLAFTSMNHSLQIPNDVSTAKHSTYRDSPTKRPMAKPQKKNFDCYFVNKAERPAPIEAQMKSAWLNTLCSQPVDEIFGKYKRRSEASRRTVQTRYKNSTPGEKALVSGWSSNASNRGSPTRSRSIRSFPSQSRNSRVSSIDTNFKVQSSEQDSDKANNHPGLALLPVGSPANCEGDIETLSPRSSPLFQKVFRYNGFSTVAPINGTNSSNGSVDSSIYEPYQRDKRFPEIRPRKAAHSPQRKIVPYEIRDERPTSETVSSVTTQELEESPIHIVSIGKFNGADKSENITMTRLTLSGKCSYRLPKNTLSMSLPFLHTAG